MAELWISHHSIEDWSEPSRWSDYLERAQEILGAKLTRLDENDPVKRQVSSLADAGAFICTFKQREDSRWIFGKLEHTGIGFSVQHFRNIGRYAHTLRWHVPVSFLEKPFALHRARELFAVGNQSLAPFYAYSDEVSCIAAKKKPSGAVDIQAELLGMFWLTHFNSSYVDFFGRKTFDNFHSLETHSDGSITVVLGEQPSTVSTELRLRAESLLGKQSFVDPSEILFKEPGRFALTFQQLRQTS